MYLCKCDLQTTTLPIHFLAQIYMYFYMENINDSWHKLFIVLNKPILSSHAFTQVRNVCLVHVHACI